MIATTHHFNFGPLGGVHGIFSTVPHEDHETNPCTAHFFELGHELGQEVEMAFIDEIEFGPLFDLKFRQYRLAQEGASNV